MLAEDARVMARNAKVIAAEARALAKEARRLSPATQPRGGRVRNDWRIVVPGNLPRPTLIGGAMTLSALTVIVLSSVVYRAIPGPNPVPLVPESATMPNLTEVPDALPVVDMEMLPTDPDAQPEELPPVAAVNGGLLADEEPVRPPEEAHSERGRKRDNVRLAALENQPDERREANDEQRASPQDQPRRAETKRAATVPRREVESVRATERERSREGQRSSERSTPETRVAGRGTHRGNGYDIKPPSGFKLRRSGRRTVWSGPDGASLLVETTRVSGGSPRDDWKRLDVDLKKRYGKRYRSLGIRRTSLAGRPAAAWEFELDTPRGTVRKMDIAVHERGRGYAVLYSAPAAKFHKVRSTLKSASRSFRLSASRERAAGERYDENRSRDSGNRYARVESAERRSGEESSRYRRSSSPAEKDQPDVRQARRAAARERVETRSDERSRRRIQRPSSGERAAPSTRHSDAPHHNMEVASDQESPVRRGY